MEHATALVSLSLLTLLIGLAIAAYQLWSADDAQKKGHHSALSARFGGKPMSRPEVRPPPQPMTAQPMTAQAAPPDAEPFPSMASPSAAASRKKGPGRSTRTAPKVADERPSPENPLN